jgi:serine/threonine-protein kinase
VSIQPGTKLGPYEVQEFIGQGAMGFVYKAYHSQLERTGAVKVLQGLAFSPDVVARFRHEAQAIAQMRHPNIVNVYDFGEFEGTPYMIVEYVPGGNLAGRMSQGPLDRATALRFLRAIGAALDYAHSQGIVHRDVKPANVLLERDETPVLADFGLAKLMQGSSVKSLTGVTTGTPAYMAPEQVTGHEVGPAVDRYSLATIAYEMLTGSIPFEGQGVLELLYAHVHLDPALPSSLKPELSQSVDAVIMRGLAKEPRARWGSCEAFVNALAAALGAKAPPLVERTIVMAAPADRIDSVQSFASPPATVPSPIWPPAAEARRESRRRRYVIAAVAVLALLTLIVTIVGFVLADSPSLPSPRPRPSQLSAPAPSPEISVSPTTVKRLGDMTVSGRQFLAGKTATIDLIQTTNTLVATPYVGSDGSVAATVRIPVTAAAGQASIRVCSNDGLGPCAYQTITIKVP